MSPFLPGGVVLRPCERRDIPAGMRLKEAAGWNQTEADWEAFLSFRPEGCFVAEVEGRVAGTVTSVVYEGLLGWIGMVLVDPALRRRGIGTRLLERALESLVGCEAVRLDSTAEGRELYRRLGFTEEGELSRLVRRRPAGAPRSPGPPGTGVAAAVEPLGRGGLAEVAARDAEVFGVSRARILEAWLERAPEYAFVAREGVAGGSVSGKLTGGAVSGLASGRASGAASGVAGYVLGRSGSRYEHLGPLVAGDMATAWRLLSRALEAVGSRPAVVDVFRHAPGWLERLRGAGFEEERRFVRMRRGSGRPAGRAEEQWAAAGPEVG